MPEIAIIGAGPGGLTAGMLLASQNFDVTIYEAENSVGGRSGWISGEGFTFDVGSTIFMMPFILEEIFAETGRSLHDYVNLEKLDPFYKVNYPDGSSLKARPDREKFIESIANISEEDAERYEDFMEDNARKMRLTLPVLQRPYSSWLDLFNRDVFRLLPVLNPHRSLWKELDRYFSDDRVKLGFTFQSNYLGMSPFNCPSMFSIIPFLEFNWGIYHVEGGLNRLARAKAEVFQELGGELVFNKEVKKAQVEKGRVTGLVFSDGDEVKVDEVVMNSDFAWSMKNLFPSHTRHKYTDSRLDRLNYSCSAFMLYLGLDRKFENLEHHNVYISSQYRENFKAIEAEREMPSDPSFYVQNASLNDDTVAPSGCSTLLALVPVSNLRSSMNWDISKENYRDMVLDRMNEEFGDGEIRDHIVYERMIDPADWRDDFRVEHGAVFNLGHNISQMMIFRPRNNFEEYKNVWLVGGGTNPGSGLPTIYESGRIAANLLQKKYGREYSFVRREKIKRAFQKQASYVE